MPTPRLIGHPDFIQYSSTPVATLIAQLGPFGPGTSAAQVINCTSGGSYILSITGDNPTNGLMTDVTISHLDVTGYTILQETYGAMPWGQFNVSPIQIEEPVLLRGNIYGTQLSIVFNSATAAYMNTVLGAAGISRANVNCNVYIIPSSLADPDPKVSTSAVFNTADIGNYTQGMLASFNGVAIPFGTDTGQIIVAPYSGPAKLTLRETGVIATPTNILVGIRSYSVANSTNALSNMEFDTVAPSVGYEWDINLPSALNVIKIQNLDGAQNGNVVAAIMADRQA
jgi:hypothetical protein